MTEVREGSVAVVLATYNGEQFLGEQLESLQNQSRMPDRLWVRDDGSSDSTVEMVRAFARQASFPVEIVDFDGNNLGSTKNFESLLQRCSDDYVFLCDQDDVWHRDKIQRISEALDKTPSATFAFSNARLIDARGRPLEGTKLWDRVGYRPPMTSVQTSEHFFARQLRGNVVTGATMAIRRTALEGALPIPEQWVHDAWLATLLSACGAAIVIDEPLIDYRQHAEQQIGADVPHMTVSSLASGDAGDRLQTNLAGMLDDFQQLQERLAAMDVGAPQREGVASAIELLRIRIAARTARRKTTPAVRALLNGQYSRYAFGLRSFVRDLLRL